MCAYAALRWVCRISNLASLATARFKGRIFKEAHSAVFSRRSFLLGFEYGNNLLYRLLGDTVHLFLCRISLTLFKASLILCIRISVILCRFSLTLYMIGCYITPFYIEFASLYMRVSSYVKLVKPFSYYV